MRRLALSAALLLAALPARAADAPAANTLTPKEIADGWILTFDGETTFGWKVEGDAKVKDGALVLGGGKETKATMPLLAGRYWLRFESEGRGRVMFDTGNGSGGDGLYDKSDSDYQFSPGKAGVLHSTTTAGGPVGADGVRHPKGEVRFDPARPPAVRFEVPAGGTLRLKNVRARPTGMKAIFNGKDLAGWKKFTGDPKRSRTEFSVTTEGWLHLKDGPGDLQTEGQYDDFLLQIECKTNGKGLNSGVFFRCLADQYQNGYEAQVHNGYKDGDRTKPADFGTGAIYRRVPARKVVANDTEWFTMTVLARGKRIATWVNGYPTVDWADDRPEDENARKGAKTGKGHLSLQGHDPTTDVDFRNIRAAELAK